MITLSKIKEHLRSISDIQIIGKDFAIGDFEYHLIGFYKKKDKQKMLLLAYNENLRDLFEEYEAERASRFDLDKADKPCTVRDEERIQIKYETAFAGIKSVNGYIVRSSQSSQMSNYEAEHAILLGEFMRNGWTCERFDDVNPDNLYVISCAIGDDEITEFADKITLTFRPESKSFLAEIPITLEIDGMNKEITLPNGETVYIRNVCIFDLYKHTEEVFASEKIRNSFSPEELAEKRKEIEKTNEEHCPKGKCFLTVEYEAPENISLNIQTKATLDSPRKRSSGAIGVIYPANTAAEHEGYKIRVATIAEPFELDVKSVEAEIFSYSVTVHIDDIDL